LFGSHWSIDDRVVVEGDRAEPETRRVRWKELQVGRDNGRGPCCWTDTRTHSGIYRCVDQPSAPGRCSVVPFIFFWFLSLPSSFLASCRPCSLG
jgi:hypothetical protein